MKSKIRHLKELFRQDEERHYPVVPQAFADYCEDGVMPSGLLETQHYKFRFYFTRWPNLQHHSRYVLDLDGPPATKHSSRSFRVVYNSIQERTYKRLCDTISDFDNDWFRHNDIFLQQLSIRHRFALVAMTNKSQQHIQAYLKGLPITAFQERVRKWDPLIHGYLPIFFPLYEKYKNKFPSMSLEKTYQKIIDTVCPHLSDQEIIECVVDLVRDIRHVFSHCPKTTHRMTLWRGVRSTPTLSYPGFTSLSLNPFHVLNYTAGNCCLQKITILPGTPLLFIGGLSSFKKELECVLPDNTRFYEIKRSMEIIPNVRKMKGNCPLTKELRRILIQHIVVV